MTKIYLDYDRAGLDAQYFMRARHPEWEEHFKRWADWSAKVRATRPARLNIAYGEKPAEKLDIFPAKSKTAPIHIFIHGGYWQAMSKEDHSFVADGLVDAGASVVIPEYTLAPNADIDEIVRQCRAAVAWVWRNGRDFGDTSRIYVSGHSAGGHLTAMMAATDWSTVGRDLPADLVKGAVPISGLFDLEPMRLCYVNDKLKLNPDQVRRQSPMRILPSRRIPMVVAVGNAETPEFHRQADSYSQALKSQGIPVETMKLPHLNHYTAVDAVGHADSQLTRAILAQMGLK